MSKQRTIDSSMENYVDNILVENLTLKRKLESKCEALTILSKEVAGSNKQRDEYRLMAEQLQEKYCQLKKLHLKPQDGYSEHESNFPKSHASDLNKSLRMETESLRQKLRDALGDVKALRGKLNEERSSTSSDSSAGNKQLEKEEVLVKQLEQVLQGKHQMEIDLQCVLDEKEELVKERDAYKCKVHRLNHELNVVLKGENHNLIDLDALIMENRFLQEHLQHAQQEQTLANQTISKYKSMLEMKRVKGTVRFGDDSSSTLLLSQKQVHHLLEKGTSSQLPNTPATLADLRSLCAALLESLSDKTLALSHQKKANRILAARISEMQQRLEALQGADVVNFPSRVLLEGYVSHEVDKDVDVSCVESVCRPVRAVQTLPLVLDESEQVSESEDNSLPPRLAQLVEKALQDMQQEARTRAHITSPSSK